jgi:hypothetical protein
MALPEQIRKQSEAVKELYKQLNDPDAGEGDANQPPANEPAEPPVADSGNGNAAPPPASEQGSGASDGEQWEHKYKTIQGMFNSQMRTAQDRITHLESLLATMAEKPAAAAPALAAPVPVMSQPLVTDADEKEYGRETLDLVRRVCKEELSAMGSAFNALQAQVQQLSVSLNTNILPKVDNVAFQQKRSAEDRFWESLTRAVPDWQRINADPVFQSWLLEVDSLTGQTRQKFLEEAQSRWDSSRVIAFFNKFAEIKGSPNNSAAQPPRAPSELEKQVAPGRSRSTPSTSSQQAATYTQADIAKFYGDVARGLYKGREQEKARIERDIFAAQRDGRIVA